MKLLKFLTLIGIIPQLALAYMPPNGSLERGRQVFGYPQQQQAPVAQQSLRVLNLQTNMVRGQFNLGTMNPFNWDFSATGIPTARQMGSDRSVPGFTSTHDFANEIDFRMALLPQLLTQSRADIIILQDLWGPLGQQMALALKNMGYDHSLQISEYQPEGFNPRNGPSMWRWSSVDEENVEAFTMGEWWASWLVNITRTRLQMGNGLLIVSKFPFVGTPQQMRFYKHPRFEEAGTMKGAIKGSVELPGGLIVDIYASQLGAASFDCTDNSDPHTCNFDRDHQRAREMQTRQLADFIKRTRTEGRPLIAGIAYPFLYYWIVTSEVRSNALPGP